MKTKTRETLLGLLAWSASVGLFLAGAALVMNRKPPAPPGAARHPAPAPARADAGVPDRQDEADSLEVDH